MRARLAALLRRMADRLASSPNVIDGSTHHLGVTRAHELRREPSLRIYIDGKEIAQELIRYKRRNGGRDLGLG